MVKCYRNEIKKGLIYKSIVGPREQGSVLHENESKNIFIDISS